MEIYPRGRIRGRVLVTSGLCLLLSLPPLIRGKALWLVPLVWVAGAGAFLIFLGKYRARRRIRLGIEKDGLPRDYREVLEEKVSFYGTLGPEERLDYETQIAVFLREHRISGVAGVVVTPMIRVLVAATAVRLVFRRPSWEFHDFGEILVYPGAFASDGTYTVGSGHADAAGMMHSQGGVILSLPHLLRAFDADNDGFNVGYHEFAHVLDGSRPDGVPGELDLGSYRPWVTVMQREFERVLRGRSFLRDYAGTNPAEFFACAVEFFFEKPDVMLEKAPELYRQLSGFFNQDPARKRGSFRRSPGPRGARPSGRAGIRRGPSSPPSP